MKPLVLLDVDGVVIPHGRVDAGSLIYPGIGTDAEQVRFAPELPGWLGRLGESFELAWATSWGLAANEELSPLLGLPQLRTILFENEVPPGADLKLPAIKRFVGDRPFAWIDDVIGNDAHAWVEARKIPALLVQTSADRGLGRDHVEELLAFAAEVRDREPWATTSAP